MPQYLVCNYIPDDFDPSTVTEAMMEEIHALNREMIASGVRKFACGIAPPANAKTLREAVRRQGARHRRAVHRDQGAHGRLLDTRMRGYRRGAGMGKKGRHRLRYTRRSARASFLPGPNPSGFVIATNPREPAIGSATHRFPLTRLKKNEGAVDFRSPERLSNNRTMSYAH